MKPVQKLYYFTATSRQGLIDIVNKFVEDYLLSDPTHEIANIMHSTFDYNISKEFNDRRQKDMTITTYEREFYCVLTIMENLDKDDPKRINLLS